MLSLNFDDSVTIIGSSFYQIDCEFFFIWTYLNFDRTGIESYYYSCGVCFFGIKYTHTHFSHIPLTCNFNVLRQGRFVAHTKWNDVIYYLNWNHIIRYVDESVPHTDTRASARERCHNGKDNKWRAAKETRKDKHIHPIQDIVSYKSDTKL